MSHKDPTGSQFPPSPSRREGEPVEPSFLVRVYTAWLEWTSGDADLNVATPKAEPLRIGHAEHGPEQTIKQDQELGGERVEKNSDYLRFFNL